MVQSLDIFKPNGLLSQSIAGYTLRESQLKMAEAIEQAIQQNAQIVIEAGTGTGKTFGYLIPIFLSDKKAIISTGTKNLQDQLFFNDIPIIQKLFSFTKKVELLKGRANYLCQHRLQRNLVDGRFASRQVISHLHTVNEWSAHTRTGDISEINIISEDSEIWSHVTSTVDNCLGQECEFYKDCFVIKARQKAINADILIVNHHLFFADLALQENGFGELLPGTEIVVFDEAHHIPDIASQFFSKNLSSRQLLELARDSEVEAYKDAKDMSVINDFSALLQKSVHTLRANLGIELRRAIWPTNLSKALEESITDVKAHLSLLEGALKEASVRSKGLENCWRRIAQLIEQFNLLTGKTPDTAVHWFETHLHNFTLQLTPIIIADYFKNYIKEEKRTWIFTSATLTVKNNFQLFISSLGLEQALQLQLKSPFNYQTQSLLYVPRGLPDSHSDTYIEQMIEKVIPVINAAKGKTFLLFTSHKAMEKAAELLTTSIDFPILLQGTQGKHQLIEKFKQLGNAVLLGTNSFWYGVDVRGNALSCVIIDKLPFASPDDPILQARIRFLRQKGLDPFQTYQLPQAVLTLKQGAGRLIRDITDSGLLMICDPRLIGARYGETFIRSLPPMPRTRELDNICQFFKSHENISH